MVAISFDPTAQAPNESFEPLPAAWYNAMIVASDYKQCAATAKDPNGWYYEFGFQVVDGPYKGRKVFANYNVKNANQQAVDIAKGDLTAIYNAIGANKENVTTTEQLHNRPLEIKVAVSPARGTYGPSNDIKGYRAIGASSGTAAPGRVAPPVAPQVAPPVAPPMAPPPAAPPPPPPVATAPVTPPPASVAPPAAPWETAAA
jgi:Protein of unknown function (DUF669)